MRINSTSNSKPKALIITIVILVLLAGGVIFAWFSPLVPWFGVKPAEQSNTKNGVNYDPATDEQIQAGNDAKEDFIDKAYGDDVEPIGDASIAVTNHGVSGSMYSIRTTISPAVTTGKCTITLKADGQSDITQSVGVQSLGSYSVCQGFDISTASLGSSTWKATIVFEATDLRASTQLEVKV